MSREEPNKNDDGGIVGILSRLLNRRFNTSCAVGLSYHVSVDVRMHECMYHDQMNHNECMLVLRYCFV